MTSNYNKTQIIDLTCKLDLPVQYSKLYDQISNNINYKYKEIIETISNENINNVYWWVSSLASKDNNISKLYHYLCCIELLIQIKDTILMKDYEIIVDNHEFKAIISELLGNDIKIKLDRNNNYKKLFKKIRNIVYSIVYSLFLHLAIKLIYPTNKLNNNTELILIDNMMLPNHESYDRYYGEMLDHLSDHQKQNIFYVYTLTGYSILNIFRGLRLLKKNKYQHTFKEKYLTVSDYIFAYLYILKIKYINVGDMYYKNINIKNLAVSDLNSSFSIYSSVTALLNFRLFFRLKLKKYKIATAINWFENQSLDKGWNFGMNKYYSDGNSHAYIGFLTYCSNFLGPYPTYSEQKAEVLPKTFFLPGKEYINNFKLFNSTLNVELAPAFRFSYINNIKIKEGIYNNILVCLDGVALKDDLKVIEIIYNLKSDLRNVNFTIKPHPCINLKLIDNFLDKKYYKSLNFVESDFSDSISNTNILISNGFTSVCIETMLLGIPVIILAKNNGFTYSPFNNTDKMFSVCYTVDEMLASIKSYLERESKMNEINIDSYIQPFNKRLLKRMLTYK
jgi:hypothetical protein